MNCTYINNTSSETQTTRIKHVYGNVLNVAIPLTQRVRTLIDGEETETEAPFYPSSDYPVYVDLNKGGGLHTTFTATMNDNVVLVQDDGTTPIGVYQVEVRCHDNDGHPCRYMVRAIIEIVDATIDAGIQAGIEFNAETYTLEGTVYYYAKGDRGYSVQKVEQIVESDENGGVNVIRVFIDDGNVFDFNVRNGKLTTEQEESLKHVVNWRGEFVLTENSLDISTPDHTFTELRDIMDSGNLIHLSVYDPENPRVVCDFLSQKEPMGYSFQASFWSNTTPEYTDCTLLWLYPHAGENDTIEWGADFILDSGDFYRKEETNKRIKDEIKPLKESKLSYTIVVSLPSPDSVELNTLYLVPDTNECYNGYFSDGRKWLPLGYIKNTSGIPKTDLEDSVQETLNHADDTYSKSEVDKLLKEIQQLVFVYVGELPQANSSTVGKIYLIPSNNVTPNNARDEYITISRDGGYRWEKIGSTEVNLDNYATLDYVTSKTKMLKILSTKPVQWQIGHESLANDMFAKLYIANGNTTQSDTDIIKPIFNIQDGNVFTLVKTRLVSKDNVTYLTSIFRSLVDVDVDTNPQTMIVQTTQNGNIVSFSVQEELSFKQRYEKCAVDDNMNIEILAQASQQLNDETNVIGKAILDLNARVNKPIGGNDNTTIINNGGESKFVDVMASGGRVLIRHSELDDDEALVVLKKVSRKFKYQESACKKNKYSWAKHIIFEPSNPEHDVSTTWYCPVVKKVYEGGGVIDISGSKSDIKKWKNKQLATNNRVDTDTVDFNDCIFVDLLNVKVSAEVFDSIPKEKDDKPSKVKFGGLANMAIKYAGHAFWPLAIAIIKVGGNGAYDRNRIVAMKKFKYIITEIDEASDSALGLKQSVQV